MPRSYPRPRWETPLPANVAGSWGPLVALWARRELGISFDRWQRRALSRALAVDADAHLVYRMYLISTARQCGKTALVRGVIGWALTALGTPAWSMILGLAHDRAQARIPYESVLADLAPIGRRVGGYGAGGLALTRYLGIRSAMHGRHREYHLGSRDAANAIRGYTVDLGIFDEVRTQIDWSTWSALEPTTTARPEPLILAISTAGDDRSVVLRSWWERGLRIIDGEEPVGRFGMTWYGAPDELEPDDPRAWREASPSIADGRIDPETIAASYRTMPASTFRAERLNLWTAGGETWLPLGVWSGAAGARPLEHGRPVLGVDVSSSWARGTIAVALPGDESTYVGVAAERVAYRDVASATVSPAAIIGALEEAERSWSPALVVYSGASPIAPHLEAWCAAHDELEAYPLTGGGIRSASELFRSELVGGRIVHPGDPLLDEHARRVRPSSPVEAGGWYLSVRESPGDVDAVRAAAWSVYGALRPPEPDVTTPIV